MSRKMLNQLYCITSENNASWVKYLPKSKKDKPFLKKAYALIFMGRLYAIVSKVILLGTKQM